jgi:hypothetical protein
MILLPEKVFRRNCENVKTCWIKALRGRDREDGDPIRDIKLSWVDGPTIEKSRKVNPQRYDRAARPQVLIRQSSMI